MVPTWNMRRRHSSVLGKHKCIWGTSRLGPFVRDQYLGEIEGSKSSNLPGKQMIKNSSWALKKEGGVFSHLVLQSGK